MKKILLITLILFVLSLTITSAMATVISLQHGQVNAIGDTGALELTMDNAPSGLSGYVITVTICDPSVARINAVSFPMWATMNSKTIFPPASVKITAVDMGGQITPDATSILLGTVYIKGFNVGTSRILINATKLNDDAGSPIDATIRNGGFTVGVPSSASVAIESDCMSAMDFLAIRSTELSPGSPFAWNRGLGKGLFSAFKNPILP
jgi:hypothetical protein